MFEGLLDFAKGGNADALRDQLLEESGQFVVRAREAEEPLRAADSDIGKLVDRMQDLPDWRIADPTQADNAEVLRLLRSDLFDFAAAHHAAFFHEPDRGAEAFEVGKDVGGEENCGSFCAETDGKGAQGGAPFAFEAG